MAQVQFPLREPKKDKIISTVWNIIIYIISSLFTLMINTTVGILMCIYIFSSQTALNLHFDVTFPNQNVERHILVCTLLG